MVQNSIMQNKEYGERRDDEPHAYSALKKLPAWLCFLACSDQNTFMNGQAIAIGGGDEAM
jgi:hypothetical protein